MQNIKTKKEELIMSVRHRLDRPVKDRTTVDINKTLLDRVRTHVTSNGEGMNDFVTRALLNQLEREGDLEIRKIMEEETEWQ